MEFFTTAIIIVVVVIAGFLYLKFRKPAVADKVEQVVKEKLHEAADAVSKATDGTKG
jgi:hypothetical protein